MKIRSNIALVMLVCGSLILALSAAPLAAAQDQHKSQPEQSRQARPAPEYRSRLAQGLGKWLGLSPEQQSQFDALEKARAEERQAMRDDMRQLSDQLKALRDDPKADPRKADALIDQLEAIRADQMKSDFRFDKDLEKILTPEQRKKFEQFRSRSERRRSYYPGYGYGYGYGFSPYYPYFPYFGFGGFYRPFFWGYRGFFGGFHGFFGPRFHNFRGFRRGFRHF